jgi:hypothetical protein
MSRRKCWLKGGRDARYRKVPILGRHQHEDAVGCQSDAEQHGQTKSQGFRHLNSLICEVRSVLSQSSKRIEPRRGLSPAARD